MSKLQLALGAVLLFAPSVQAAPVFDPGGFTALRLAPVEERTRKPAPFEVQPWPSGLLESERTHYLSSGSLTAVLLPVANPNSVTLKAGKLVLELPETVTIPVVSAYLTWASREEVPITRDGQPYRRYTFNCMVHPTTIPLGPMGSGYFGRYRPPGIWVRTEAPPGTALGKLYMRFLYQAEGSDTFETGPETSVDLKASDKLVSAQPKLVSSGIMARFNLNRSNQPPDVPERLLAEYLKQLGFSYAVTGLNLPPDGGVKQWREAWLQNAYEFNAPDIPEDQKFVLNGKKLDKVLTPSAIYHPTPWVKEHVLKAIADQITSANVTGLWVNFEPHRYSRTGCQSERNRDEFIEWSKLPREEVLAAWPNDIPKKYPEQWRNFLNWQLKESVRVVNDVLEEKGRQFNTRPRLYIATSNDFITSSPDDPLYVLGWGDMPIGLQTWSFYFVPHYAEKKPQTDRPGAVQVTRFRAFDDILDEKLGANRQLIWGGLYGWDQTGGGGFFYPEQLGFLHESTIMAGAENVQNYAAWTVWDGRYATAMAKANASIARWEEFTMNGKKQRQHVVIPVTPYPQAVPATVKPADQEILGDWGSEREKTYIYSFEYALAAKRLFIIANTWSEGDVFTRLRIYGLDPKRKFVLREPESDRCFVPSAGKPAWTGAELAEGAVVQTGAMRLSKFLVEEYVPGQKYESPVTPQEVTTAIGLRKPVPVPVAAVNGPK